MAKLSPEIVKRVTDQREAEQRGNTRSLQLWVLFVVWGFTLLSATSAVDFVRACFAVFGLVLVVGSTLLALRREIQFRKRRHCGYCSAAISFNGRLLDRCPCCNGLIEPLKQLHWTSGPLNFEEWVNPKRGWSIPPFPQFLAMSISLAVESNAEEVRFEPEEEHLRVDCRKGDEINELSDMPWKSQQAAELVQWVKVLSGLDQHQTVERQTGGVLLFKHRDWEWIAYVVTEPAAVAEKIIIRFEKYEPLPTLVS